MRPPRNKLPTFAKAPFLFSVPSRASPLASGGAGAFRDTRVRIGEGDEHIAGDRTLRFFSVCAPSILMLGRSLHLLVQLGRKLFRVDVIRQIDLPLPAFLDERDRRSGGCFS